MHRFPISGSGYILRSAEKNLDCFNDNECLNSYNTAFYYFREWIQFRAGRSATS